MEKREYLKNGDRAFTECWIMWNAEKKAFEFDGIAEGSWFDGKDLSFDKKTDHILKNKRRWKNHGRKNV